MEYSQPARPHGVTDSEDPHSVGLQSGEKKSVLNKVKAKARKIKDTLTTKYGHGHDHAEEDEETVEDPEVQGAPAVPGQDVNLGQPKANLEKPTVLKGNRYDSKMTDPPSSPLREEAVHVPGDKPVSFPDETHGTRGNTGTTGDNVGKTDLEAEVPDAPRGRPEAFSDQTKVGDPTGTAGITPLLDAFNKMNVYDESAPTSKPGTGQVQHTGSHDQLSPAGSHDQLSPEPIFTPKRTGSHDQLSPAGSHDQLSPDPIFMPKPGTGQVQHTGSYDQLSPVGSHDHSRNHDQLSPAGSHDQLPISMPKPGTGQVQHTRSHDELSPAGSHDLFSPEPISTSKPGTGQVQHTRSHDELSPAGSHDLFSPEPISTSKPGTGQVQHIRSHDQLSPAGSHDQLPISTPKPGTGQVQYTGSHDQLSPESISTPQPGAGQVQHTGSHDQLSPEPISTITPTTPGINESSPKKFDATETENVPRDNTSGTYTDMASSTTSAITGKAVSAKNVIASKLGYGNKEDNRPPEMLHEKGETGNVESVGEYGPKITSAETEKLAPVYDEVAETEKVTKSEEVARPLGTDNEDTKNYKGDGVSGNVSPAKGMVGRLTGAVGSWFGKPSESQIPQESHGTSYEGTEGFPSNANEGDTKGHKDGGQRRLEESGN